MDIRSPAGICDAANCDSAGDRVFRFPQLYKICILYNCMYQFRGVACFEFRSPRLIQNPLFYIIALLHAFLYIHSSHIAASFTRRMIHPVIRFIRLMMIHPFDDTLVNSRLRWFFAGSISHYVKHYRSVSKILRLNNTFAFPNQHHIRQLIFPRLSKSTPHLPIDVPMPPQNNSTSAYPL